MIKDDRQLESAEQEIERLQRDIQELRESYSGLEEIILTRGLERQIHDITTEIREYRGLRALSLEEAVMSLLREPVAIEEIGELLAKLRIAADLTQSELADRLDWHQSNVSRFESENYSSQTIVKIVEYASALGILLQVIPVLWDLSPDETLVDVQSQTRFEPFGPSDLNTTSNPEDVYRRVQIDDTRLTSEVEPQFQGEPQAELV